MGASTWYTSILTQADFRLVYPSRAKFIDQLKDLSERKQAVLADDSLSDQDKTDRLKRLAIRTASGAECSLEDLWLVLIIVIFRSALSLFLDIKAFSALGIYLYTKPNVVLDETKILGYESFNVDFNLSPNYRRCRSGFNQSCYAITRHDW